MSRRRNNPKHAKKVCSTVKALAELIAKTAGFKGKLAFNSSKPDGTMRKLTDVSKLHELGWHHKIEIEEGIRNQIPGI